MNQPRGRPFAPGNTQGRGRSKGSRNKAGKSAGQNLLDEYGEPVIRKCLALAMQGVPTALRLCMERISPARRGGCIQMKLPVIKTEADVDKAAEKVTHSIGRADITPTEAGTVMNILESRSRVIERVQLESRLEKLEENAAANQTRLAA